LYKTHTKAKPLGIKEKVRGNLNNEYVHVLHIVVFVGGSKNISPGCKKRNVMNKGEMTLLVPPAYFVQRVNGVKYLQTRVMPRRTTTLSAITVHQN
jgi:hypothetical protein